MRNISNKYVEQIKTHTLYVQSPFFPPKIAPFIR